MSSLEIIEKLAPWIFYLASLIFIIIAALHIKHLREQELKDRISLQEDEINEKFKDYSDIDVVNSINELESGSGIADPKK